MAKIYKLVKSEQRRLEQVNPKTLVRLRTVENLYPDAFISPAIGAVTRSGTGTSQHFIRSDGFSRAIDIMFPSLKTRSQAEYLFKVLIDIGFTGIGFYPYWKPTMGFHVDMRSNKLSGSPAKWGRVKGKYVGIAEAFGKI